MNELQFPDLWSWGNNNHLLCPPLKTVTRIQWENICKRFLYVYMNVMNILIMALINILTMVVLMLRWHSTCSSPVFLQLGVEGSNSDVWSWMGQQLHLTCLAHCFSKLQSVPLCVLSRISQNITLSLPMSPSSSLAPTCPYAQPWPELLNHSSCDNLVLSGRSARMGATGEQILSPSLSTFST